MSICYASDAPPAGHFHIFRQVVLPIYRPSRSRQRLIGDLLKPRVCPQPRSVYLSICPRRTRLSTPSISSRGSSSGWTRRLLVPRPDRRWVSRLTRRRRVCGAEGGPGGGIGTASSSWLSDGGLQSVACAQLGLLSFSTRHDSRAWVLCCRCKTTASIDVERSRSCTAEMELTRCMLACSAGLDSPVPGQPRVVL